MTVHGRTIRGDGGHAVEFETPPALCASCDPSSLMPAAIFAFLPREVVAHTDAACRSEGFGSMDWNSLRAVKVPLAESEN